MVEGDREAVEKVLREVAESAGDIDMDDRARLADKLRREAWQPTQDAIGVAASSRVAFIGILCSSCVDMVRVSHVESWQPSSSARENPPEKPDIFLIISRSGLDILYVTVELSSAAETGPSL